MVFEFVVGKTSIFVIVRMLQRGNVEVTPAVLSNTTSTRMKIGDVAALILSFGTIWQ